MKPHSIILTSTLIGQLLTNFEMQLFGKMQTHNIRYMQNADKKITNLTVRIWCVSAVCKL